MKLSIIIPTFNEAANIVTTLQRLQMWRELGHEVIVADGGSTDETCLLAETLADHVFVSPQKGRAAQMNAGAQCAAGEVVLFLHADTLMPIEALDSVLQGFSDPQKQWGRFDVRLSGSKTVFRVIEALMNWRSRMTGIATGDQGLFVRKNVFNKLGGFPDMPLMEDVALSARLKRISKPFCSPVKLATSSRRWERNGIWRTIFLMWYLRLSFFLGANPEQLARRYK